MQFQVPQFIEVEDKIFGPFTFKQFVYMAGGLGFAYLLWRVLPTFVAAPIGLAVVGFAAALAFMEYNGRPFLIAVETAFYYIIHSKLYLWNNQTRARVDKAKKEPVAPQANLYVPKLSESRLHELAWSLDIKERIAAGVGDASDRTAARDLNVMSPLRTPQRAIRSLTQ